ncbi:MAG: cell division protein FtsZ [Myxococcales bacterium]|nr:cell division protein FtsZ [Myxococcales bacterium]
MIELADVSHQGAHIKVIGVGGGGGNAINNMIEEELDGVEFIAANTDAQALRQSLAPTKIQLGEKVTRGLGAGANPDVGRRAAAEDQGRLTEYLEGADMVFITAGMGGGTGTGAAPIIANVAKEAGALTVAIVTKPFGFEGKRRMAFAESGLEELRKSVDTLIVLPNDKLLELGDESTTMKDSFKLSDTVLLNAVRGISDLILVPGLINVDFADVKTVMTSKGRALMSTGVGIGEHRAETAARAAIESPLLEDESLKGARGMLVNITGPADLSLHEVNRAIRIISDMGGDDCNTICGAVINPDLDDEIKITVIATGFDAAMPQYAGRHHAADEFAQPVRRPAAQPRHTEYHEPRQEPRQAEHRQEARQAPPAPPAQSPRLTVAPPPPPVNYDEPTVNRNNKQRDSRPVDDRLQANANPFNETDESELDTPAFLRNKSAPSKWGLFDRKK